MGDQASQGAVPRFVGIELVVELAGSEDATLERPELVQEVGLLFESAEEQKNREDRVLAGHSGLAQGDAVIIVTGLLSCCQGAHSGHIILDLGMAIAEQERLAAQAPPFRQGERRNLRIIEDPGRGGSPGIKATGFQDRDKGDASGEDAARIAKDDPITVPVYSEHRIRLVLSGERAGGLHFALAGRVGRAGGEFAIGREAMGKDVRASPRENLVDFRTSRAVEGIEHDGQTGEVAGLDPGGMEREINVFPGEVQQGE